MSTRIGITLEKELYEKYKEYLFKNRKTIQEDLTEKIRNTVYNQLGTKHNDTPGRG